MKYQSDMKLSFDDVKPQKKGVTTKKEESLKDSFFADDPYRTGAEIAMSL